MGNILAPVRIRFADPPHKEFSSVSDASWQLERDRKTIKNYLKSGRMQAWSEEEQRWLTRSEYLASLPARKAVAKAQARADIARKVWEMSPEGIRAKKKAARLKHEAFIESISKPVFDKTTNWQRERRFWSSVRDAAEANGVSSPTIRRWIANGTFGYMTREDYNFWRDQ